MSGVTHQVDAHALSRPLVRARLAGQAAGLALPSAVASVVLFAFAIASAALTVVWVGVPLSVLAVIGIRRLANTQRSWSARLFAVPISRRYRSDVEDPKAGWLGRLRGCLTDPATARDLLWLPVNGVVGLALGILPATFLLATVYYLADPAMYWLAPAPFSHPFRALTLHGVGQAFGLWLVAAVAFALFWTTTRPLLRAYAALAHWLLAPDEQGRLAARVVELTQSRAETVDAQAAELRRIERDLHDGAQARLVALGMNLGMAEMLLASDPDALADLLAEARESTGLALSELRALVRGIHPPVLSDRGLDGAVRALAMACPVPVDVGIDLPGRPDAPVESAMYFAIAETLTNLAKHSEATRGWLRLTYENGGLRAVIGDDGRGGVVIDPAGGLHGVRRRLAAFDGILDAASPPGGPTTITMELPCALS